MASFTSRSKQQVPGVAVKLVMTALALWGLGAGYSLWLSPQMDFYVQMAELQSRWARKMEREHGPKLVIIGGSSAMFSIIGERLPPIMDWPR